MLVALQIIVITVLSIVIYNSTVNTYLMAKNDVIGYWLDASREYILSDPEYARLMLHLIDEDLEYQMSEREEDHGTDNNNDIVVGEYRSTVSDGVLINEYMTTITLSVMSDEEATGGFPVPSILLFDSLDGRFHADEKEIKELNYFEYGEITYDLRAVTGGTRKLSRRWKTGVHRSSDTRANI